MRGLDRRRFLAGVAVLALPAARAATPLGWLSGLTTDGGSGGDPDAVRAWGEWRGAPVGIVNLKSRRNADWRHLANSFRQKEPVYDALNGMGVRVSQTLPLWPQDSGSADPLKDCAAGAFDGHHREIARMLAGYRPLPGMVLRLAHECSSASQRDWMGLDPDRVRFPTWRAAWRRVGSIYLDAIPGLGLEWNHIRRPAIDVRGGYPGDDLVAIVGVDCYNNGEAIVDDASWNEYADRGAAGRPQGPRAWLRYAVGLGKRVSYAEWAVTNERGAGDLRDSPRFVRGMGELFRDEAEHVAYECYFNCRGVGAKDHRLREEGADSAWNPLAAAAYRELWSAIG